jgi:NADPH:quinone reductase
VNAVRAVLLRAFGTPEVLVATEVADPVAEPGQAVIDVEYVNLTFVETQIRAGRPPNPAMRPELPSSRATGSAAWWVTSARAWTRH